MAGSFEFAKNCQMNCQGIAESGLLAPLLDQIAARG
jgi:hypothetical protein